MAPDRKGRKKRPTKRVKRRGTSGDDEIKRNGGGKELLDPLESIRLVTRDSGT